MTELRASQALNLAADILQSDGWHQGGYAPEPHEDGTSMTGLPVCTMGALYLAQGQPIVWSEDLACWVGMCDDGMPTGTFELVDYLKVENIPHWNDRVATSAAEVVEVLRAAALVEAAREDAALLAEAGRV